MEFIEYKLLLLSVWNYSLHNVPKFFTIFVLSDAKGKTRSRSRCLFATCSFWKWASEVRLDRPPKGTLGLARAFYMHGSAWDRRAIFDSIMARKGLFDWIIFTFRLIIRHTTYSWINTPAWFVATRSCVKGDVWDTFKGIESYWIVSLNIQYLTVVWRSIKLLCECKFY